MVNSKNDPRGSNSSDWESSSDDESLSGSEYIELRRKLFVPRRSSVPQGMVSVLREKFEKPTSDGVPDNLVKSRKSKFEHINAASAVHQNGESVIARREVYEVNNSESVAENAVNSNRNVFENGEFEEDGDKLITSKREVFETANGEVVVQQTSAVFRRESIKLTKSVYTHEEIIDDPVPEKTTEIPKPKKLSKSIRAVFENPEALEREEKQKEEDEPKTLVQSIRKMFEQSKVQENKPTKSAISRRHTIHSTKQFTPGKLPASKREMFENASSTPNLPQAVSRRQTIDISKLTRRYHGELNRSISGPSRTTSVTGSQDGINRSAPSRTTSVTGSRDGINRSTPGPSKTTSVTRSQDGINRSAPSRKTSVTGSRDGINRSTSRPSKTTSVTRSQDGINRSAPSRTTSVTASRDSILRSSNSRISYIMGSHDDINRPGERRPTSLKGSQDAINRSIYRTVSTPGSQEAINREGYDDPPSPVGIYRSISEHSTLGHDTPNLISESEQYGFRREESVERLPRQISSVSRTINSGKYDLMASESEVFEDAIPDEVDTPEFDYEPVFKIQESVPEGIVNMRRRLFENLKK